MVLTCQISNFANDHIRADPMRAPGTEILWCKSSYVFVQNPMSQSSNPDGDPSDHTIFDQVENIIDMLNLTRISTGKSNALTRIAGAKQMTYNCTTTSYATVVAHTTTAPTRHSSSVLAVSPRMRLSPNLTRNGSTLKRNRSPMVKPASTT